MWLCLYKYVCEEYVKSCMLFFFFFTVSDNPNAIGLWLLTWLYEEPVKAFQFQQYL